VYGSGKDIRRNLALFFLDGVVFTPAMTLISITSVIPYFLTQLGATTFQVGLAASLALICNFISQPVFGRIASHSIMMHRTFGKILLLQRIIFMLFVLCIPVFAGFGRLMVWAFLFFWGVFNIFVGSYNVFYTPLVLKLLPPDKRGALRGMGNAAGSLLGVGAAALIPILLDRAAFPGNYTLIFSIGSVLLLIDGALFLIMRMPADAEPNTPMGMLQYIREMPAAVRGNAPFRAMVLTCMFLVAANSLLAYYTLYAIRVFSATESQVGILAALAVIAGAVGYVVFGIAVDRRGPQVTTVISAALVVISGALALTTHSLSLLYVAWALANLASSCYMVSAALLLGKVSPSSKLPLYVGVYAVISLSLSSAMLLLLAPALERVGFIPLFAAVLLCGAFSLLSNIFILKRRL